MSVAVLSVIREVQRMQLKFSSWSLARLRPLHFLSKCFFECNCFFLHPEMTGESGEELCLLEF